MRFSCLTAVLALICAGCGTPPKPQQADGGSLFSNPFISPPGWIAMLLCVMLCGCLSFKRGDFEMHANAVEIQSREITYCRTVDGGTNEYFNLKAPSSSSSDTVHWFCNTTLAIAGGFGGFSVGGPVGAAGGAAAGAGLSELVQKYLDKAKHLIGK